MSDTINTINALTELVREAEESRLDAETRLSAIQAEADQLSREVEVLRTEEEAFRAALRRRSPDNGAPREIEAAPSNGGRSVFFAAVDSPETRAMVEWTGLPRTTAVERAVREILSVDDYASPSEVQKLLEHYGRSDSRDDIGSALSYLSRNEKIHNIGRGQWVLSEAEQTSEGTAFAMPSDTQKDGE